MQLIRAPQMILPGRLARPVVFCAGSIEMGAASDWQHLAAERLDGLPGTLLSPRRLEWDASWPQVPDHGPFHQQVSWELDGILDHADLLLFHFEPGTRSRPVAWCRTGSVGT